MQTRRFSLEDDFMNYKVNDLLFGFMRSISTASPGENGQWNEYLAKKEFVKNKKIIAEICGCSVRTIERHVDSLIDRGLITEDKIKISKVLKNGNVETYDYDVYRFPYDYNSKYEIVNKEMIKYLIYTRNAHAIKIYLYLLNKFKWKPGYLFTKQELKLALGYSANTRGQVVEEMIGAILTSFCREGILTIEKNITMEEVCGRTIPVERMKLIGVETDPEKL